MHHLADFMRAVAAAGAKTLLQLDLMLKATEIE